MTTLIQGDCLIKLKEIEDNSIDSIVTDPPYELGFMGKSWDSTGIANNKEMWAECLRVLKPGGHLLAFSGTRTYHRMASAIEDAGFEVRDMIEWVYGSGFPKSLNIGKVMDKFLKTGNASWNGTGDSTNGALGYSKLQNDQGYRPADYSNRHQNTSEITENKAKEWEGWGTALKPAHEPICMARKPLAEKTVAENCLKWGTGGINIDESRVGTGVIPALKRGNAVNVSFQSGGFTEEHTGRFPANLIHDNSEEVRECFPETKSGARSSKHKIGNGDGEMFNHGIYGKYKAKNFDDAPADSGNASRFFKSIIYNAKASKSERNKGTNNYLIVNICVENMARAELPPKDISESIKKWLTELFGKATMEKYQMDILSTTKTETNKTTILITLNSKLPLNIKDCIVDAFKTRKENGGNPADCAENTNESKQIITNELTEFILGANLVQSKERLKISISENNFHTTVKPIALMEYLIKMVTPKGGIVLDPFMGSGSTGVAAKKNGYDFIGIEMEEDYIKIAKARIENYK